MIDIIDKFYGVGIDAVKVDKERNMVTVNGTIGSGKIIKKLEDWGKKAVLLHERKETNPIKVEIMDDDEVEENDLPNDSFRHKDSSFRHKDSKFRHRRSSDHHNDSAFHAREGGGSHAPEKHDNPERNCAKEYPKHICRDKYCTYHKRENSMPKMDHGASYPLMFEDGLNYNYPMMNLFPLPPYGPPPLYYEEYYDPEVMPPAGYGHFSYRRRHGCNIM